MTARDDYPLHPQLHPIVFDQWGRMCDEIDRLRERVVRLSHDLDERDLRLTALRECLGACMRESLI